MPAYDYEILRNPVSSVVIHSFRKGNKSPSLGEEMLYFVKLFCILICLLF